MGAHVLESHVSDQSTSHHGNNEVNDNDDSQSFEIPSKNNLSSSSPTLSEISFLMIVLANILTYNSINT